MEPCLVSLGVQFMEGAEVLDLGRDSAGHLCGISLRSAEGEQQHLNCRCSRSKGKCCPCKAPGKHLNG